MDRPSLLQALKAVQNGAGRSFSVRGQFVGFVLVHMKNVAVLLLPRRHNGAGGVVTTNTRA
jgi:hypothetical protein